MTSLKIYYVKEEYIKYLRQFDKKVTIIKDTGKKRPYIGVVYKINEFNYFAPFSSPEKDDNGNLAEDYKKYFNKNNVPTYERIDELKYGVILINNMIPIPESQLIEFNINDMEDNNYRNILKDQFVYCDDNKERIITKAKKLYKLVTVYKQRHFVQVACNFNWLEQKCKEYEVLNQLNLTKEQVALVKFNF